MLVVINVMDAGDAPAFYIKLDCFHFSATISLLPGCALEVLFGQDLRSLLPNGNLCWEESLTF